MPAEEKPRAGQNQGYSASSMYSTLPVAVDAEHFWNSPWLGYAVPGLSRLGSGTPQSVDDSLTLLIGPIRASILRALERPTSMGRLGGHGSGPGCGPNPSSRSNAATTGTSAGVVATARSTMPLPGSPGTAVLPMCSTVRSGRRSWMSSVTAAATSIVLGSHGSTVGGSRT